MHCFACDRLLENPSMDRPTGRFYCSECFEPTVSEIQRIASKDEYLHLGDDPFSNVFRVVDIYDFGEDLSSISEINDYEVTDEDYIYE